MTNRSRVKVRERRRTSPIAGRFSDYAIDGPRGGVYTYWTGTSWTTSGSGQVCFMEELGCARQEVCSDGIDNDGDGTVDEGC